MFGNSRNTSLESGWTLSTYYTDDPHFLDTSATPPDLHVESTVGSLRNNTLRWTIDAHCSGAIDRAPATDAHNLEPSPNGGRRDLGAYGNTAEASKSCNPDRTLPVSPTPQGSGSSDAAAARAVDLLFDNWHGADRPGCAVGVSRNGRVVYEHGYGMGNLETGTPIQPSSIFHVASVSKQFTAMSVMLLARDRKLSIDDNIRKYLPEIPDYGTPITLRHLLTHTSGLRDQWELIALARGRFQENRITEADVMEIVPRQKALNFTPGAEYLYSNTGFTLLGVLVKRVTGQSLRNFADERIFKPLGMTNTHFHDDYTMLVPGRTSAYAQRGNGWRVSIPNFDVYGATDLFTT